MANKLKNGDEGFKWEIVYKDIEGMIEKIGFKDTDYGKNLEVEIDGAVLSVGVKTNYGTDLMKKLPEVDLSQPVKVVPYQFTDDQGKERKGITIYQNEKKIPSYFHIMDGTKFKSINDFPIPENAGVGFTKNQWKAFYLKVEDFLIAYTENSVIPKLVKEIASVAKEYEGTNDAVENAREIIGEETDELSTQVPF